MPNTLNIGNAALSSQATTVEDYSVNAMNTDAATGEKESEWQNPRWATQFGYFNAIPDLKSAIIAKAVWNVGKGWTSDVETKVILEHIKGFGKDTFDDILFNAELCMSIGGDAFIEIIRDPKTNIIINLKPLDPSTIKIIVNDQGIIKRYEQTAKTTKEVIKFKPEDILHLSNNRVADQIHGLSDIDALEQTLLAEGESFTNMKKIMARQAKPLIMFKLGTDDQTKINAFIAKMDQATQKGENIYIPDDASSVSYEVVQVSPSPIVLNWRDDIRSKFYRSIGLPELLPNSSGATESGGKIGYLAFEQIVERHQRYLEQQLWAQLNLKINLIPPATLSENLQQDNAKDPSAFIPSDVTAGVGQ